MERLSVILLVLALGSCGKDKEPSREENPSGETDGSGEDDGGEEDVFTEKLADSLRGLWMTPAEQNAEIDHYFIVARGGETDAWSTNDVETSYLSFFDDLKSAESNAFDEFETYQVTKSTGEVVELESEELDKTITVTFGTLADEKRITVDWDGESHEYMRYEDFNDAAGESLFDNFLDQENGDCLEDSDTKVILSRQLTELFDVLIPINASESITILGGSITEALLLYTLQVVQKKKSDEFTSYCEEKKLPVELVAHRWSLATYLDANLHFGVLTILSSLAIHLIIAL